MKNLNKLILFLIILVAIGLRLWNLGGVPPSPDWDEASLGYNAISLMQTGMDEYGQRLPVILRSFDDYKPALYAYLIIPFVKLLGLSTFVVRLPSAIFGIIAVISAYFLVRELFEKSREKEYLALLSAFLLAISPWHLQFSRIAFEAQVGLSLNMLSLLFFMKGLKNKYFLFLSAAFAATSIYVYQSEKVYLPILFLILSLIYHRKITSLPKAAVLGSIMFGLILILPMLHGIIFNENALLRAKGVSVFSDQTQFLRRNSVKFAEDKNRNDLLGIVVDNRRVEYAKAVVSGYISHYNLNFLFVTSDIERHHAPGMGLMYLFELPFLLIGIYILFFWPYSIKTKLTVFSIFLIAPIPASITSGVPHAVRTINFLPSLQIFVALGMVHSFLYIFKIKKWYLPLVLKRLTIFFFLSIFSLNIVYYLNQYFVQQNFFHSESWQYGYKEAIDYIKPVQNNYKKIVVTNDRPLDQSYIFFLYYLEYDPKQYLAEGGTRSGGFKEAHSFGKYEFRNINWEKEESGNLYIGRPDDFPKSVNRIKTVNYLDGKPAIVIVSK